ncbi:MAG: phytoene desaturase family protein [Flavobacteriaceae bacterium]|nr:phytoene desaturase family protein [Flavobacteriaceae bacterium]
MKKNVYILGSGFSSLAASCYLARAGYEVSVLEKNAHIGGRARQWKHQGFTFDMGPSFYWMPDVFDTFFSDFEKKTSDYYSLHQLNPAYEVVFKNQNIAIPDNLDAICKLFESLETGAGKKLRAYIDKAGDNYRLAIQNLVYQPGESIFEIFTAETVAKLPLFFGTIKKDSQRLFDEEELRQIVQFPVLFLGAKPAQTPSFYNFMNYADFQLGTWYPEGGMYAVVAAMVTLAKSLGVSFKTDSEVVKMVIDPKRKAVSELHTQKHVFFPDIVLSGADYAHTEQLLPATYRQYQESYWAKKVFAPSALLFYIGFDCEIPNVAHHSLFFDTDFERHAAAIYDDKTWPEDPLFYASFPTKTDKTAAPNGKEAAIILIPLATAMQDDKSLHKSYFEMILSRLSRKVGRSLQEKVLFYRSFGIDDFKKEYHAYGGNAYGLANTLLQTHILRPKMKSKKLHNLFFTGQLTVPGPGVPPALISGKIVSQLIQKYVPV